jgi:hypothetical protein
MLQPNDGQYVYGQSTDHFGDQCIVYKSHANVNRRIIFHGSDICGLRSVRGAPHLIVVMEWLRGGGGSTITIGNLMTGSDWCSFDFPRIIDSVISYMDLKTGDLKIIIASTWDISIYCHTKTTFYLQEQFEVQKRVTDHQLRGLIQLFVDSDILVTCLLNSVLAFSTSHPTQYLGGIFAMDINIAMQFIRHVIVDRTIYILAKTDDGDGFGFHVFWIRWQPTIGYQLGKEKRKRSDRYPSCWSAGPFLAEFYAFDNRIDMVRTDTLCFSHSISTQKP